VDDEKLKPNYVQQKMLALSGQNIDDFMKEMESVQKKKELERLAEEEKAKTKDSDAESAKASEESDSDDSDDSDDDDDDDDDKPAGLRLGSKAAPSATTAVIPNLTSLISLPPIPSSAPPVSLQPPHPIGLPPGMMFRPPPLRPGLSGIRMPPGPPPGRMPRMAIRMPPPPPGMPRHMHHHPKGHHHGQQQPGGLNVVSAAPQLTSKDPKSATITAKPQIRFVLPTDSVGFLRKTLLFFVFFYRNLSADVTRFVPSTLRTKRDDVKKPKPKPFVQDTKQAEQTKGPTKDDAYMQFMNEMQGLL
jgi:WW domain-binding protein 11